MADDRSQSPDDPDVPPLEPTIAQPREPLEKTIDSVDAAGDASISIGGDVRDKADTLPSTIPERDGPAPTSRRFGDYEIERELARGGMGVVFQARQISLNRPVALKMILASQLASADDVQRFHVEAEAAAKLDHPGIVPIHEVGEHDGQHFFSMGLVEGGSLADLVEGGPLSPRRAAELMQRIAGAIQYAHARNVVHRDLKPANILLDADGLPKVTDFGLAKNVDRESGLTATGQIMGTPSYMPPEQARGEMQQVGPLADVYSLGAILYFLITGRPPFEGTNVMETLNQVLERKPVSPRQHNERIDRDLETICLKCLRKEPEKRYASAAEFADELARYLDGEPITARPVGRVERSAKWVKRHKGLTAGLGTAVLAMLLGTGIATWQAIRANEAAAEKEFQRQAAEDEKRVAQQAKDRAKQLAASEAIARKKSDDAALQLLKASNSAFRNVGEANLAKLQALWISKEAGRQAKARKILQESAKLRQTAVAFADRLKPADRDATRKFWQEITPRYRDQALRWLTLTSLSPLKEVSYPFTRSGFAFLFPGQFALSRDGKRLARHTYDEKLKKGDLQIVERQTNNVVAGGAMTPGRMPVAIGFAADAATLLVVTTGRRIGRSFSFNLEHRTGKDLRVTKTLTLQVDRPSLAGRERYWFNGPATRFLYAGRYGSAVWDVASGRRLFADKSVRIVGIVDDKNRIVGVRDQSNVQVINLADGNVVQEFRLPVAVPKFVGRFPSGSAVVSSLDGKWLMVELERRRGGANASVRPLLLYSLETGRKVADVNLPVARAPYAPFVKAAFHPTRPILIVNDGQAVFLVAVPQGGILHQAAMPDADPAGGRRVMPYHVQFSPSGELLTGLHQYWYTATRRPSSRGPRKPASIRLRFWDVAMGTAGQQAVAVNGKLRDFEFADDDSLAVVDGPDGSTTVSVRSGTGTRWTVPLVKYEPLTPGVPDVRTGGFEPSERHFVEIRPDRFDIYDVATGRLLKSIPRRAGEGIAKSGRRPLTLPFNASHRWLVGVDGGGAEARVRLFDATNLKWTATLLKPPHLLDRILFDPLGRYLIVNSHRVAGLPTRRSVPSTSIYRAADGAKVLEFPLELHEFRFTRAGYLLTTTTARLAGRWRDRKRREFEVRINGDRLEATMLTEAGKKDWTSATGVLKGSTISSLAYRGGKNAATRVTGTVGDGTIRWSDNSYWSAVALHKLNRAYDLKTGRLVAQFESPTFSVLNTRFSRDGKTAVFHVAYGAGLRRMQAWRFAEGKPPRTLSVECQRVPSMAVSSDRLLIAAEVPAKRDPKLKFAGHWRDSRGRQIAVRQVGDRIEASMLTASGRQQWTSATGTVKSDAVTGMVYHLDKNVVDRLTGTIDNRDARIRWSNRTTWTRMPDPMHSLVQLVDLDTGKVIRTVETKDSVHVQLSERSGKALVFYSRYKHRLEILALKTGETLATFTGPGYVPVRGGRLVVLRGNKVLDLSTMKTVPLPDGGLGGRLLISSDGRYHVRRTQVSDEEFRLRVVDLHAPAKSWSTETVFRNPVVHLSPDNRFLGVAAQNAVSRLHLYSLATGKKLRTIFTSPRRLRTDRSTQATPASFQFSRTGKYVASRQWNRVSFAKTDALRAHAATPRAGHFGPVNAAAVSLDGRFVASGSSDGTVCFWAVTDGRYLGMIDERVEQSAVIRIVIFSRQGSLIGIRKENGEISVWKWSRAQPDGKVAEAFLWANGRRTGTRLTFSPDGKLLAAGDENGDVRLFDPQSGKLVQWLKSAGESGASQALAFSADGKLLAAARDRVIALWDIQAGRLLRAWDGQQGTIRDLAFQPGSRRLLSAGTDVRIWDPASGALFLRLPQRSQFVGGVRFNPSGRDFAIALGDAALQVTNISDFLATLDKLGLSMPVTAPAEVKGKQPLWVAQTRQAIVVENTLADSIPKALQAERHKDWKLAVTHLTRLMNVPLKDAGQGSRSGLLKRRMAAYVGLKDWTAAAKDASVVLDEMPGSWSRSASRRRFLSKTYFESPDLFAALEKIRPRDGMFSLVRGEALVRQSKWQQAESAYENVVRNVPAGDEWIEFAALCLLCGDDKAYRKHLAWMLEQRKQPKTISEYNLLARAAGLSADANVPAAKRNEWAEALAATRIRLPFNAAALTYYRIGKLEQARALLPKSAATAGSNWRLLIGMIECDLGNLEQSEEMLKRDPKVLPPPNGRNSSAVSYWLEHHVLLQQLEATVAEARAYRDQRNAGLAHQQAGRLNEALAAFRKAHTLALRSSANTLAGLQRQAAARVDLGLVLAKLGKATEAQPMLTRGLEQFNQLERHSWIPPERILAGATQVLTQSPDNRGAHWAAATVLNVQGDLPAARKHLEKLVELVPSDDRYAGALGEVILKAHKPKWSVLKLSPASARRFGLTIQKDGSISPTRSGSSYELQFEGSLKGLRGIRLETFPDRRWSPGRIGEFSVETPTGPVPIAGAVADAGPSGGEQTVERALDGNRLTSWEVPPDNPHWGVFELSRPLAADPSGIVVKIQSGAYRYSGTTRSTTLGRLRLSGTTDAPLVDVRRALARSALNGFAILGLAHVVDGKPKQAVATIATALKKAKDADARAAVLKQVVAVDEARRILLQHRPQDAELRVALARHLLERNRPKEARSQLERALALDPKNAAVASELAKLIAGWRVLTPDEMRAADRGTILTRRNDGSLFVSGTNPSRAVYTLTFKPSKAPIAAIRLETLPDARLPRGGAGRYSGSGNFHLAELTASLIPADGAGTPKPIALAKATADFQVPTGLAHFIIDGNIRTVWDTNGKIQQPHWAIVEFKEPVRTNDGKLQITLDSGLSSRHGLGRFRLSATAIIAKRIDGFAALGAAHAAEGNTEQAVAALATALDRAANAAARADVLKYVSANEEVLKGLMKLRPKDPAIHVAKARRLLELKRTQDARSELEVALKCDPASASAAAELARLLLSGAPVKWTVLKPAQLKAEGGTTLTRQTDGSLLAGGANPHNQTYTIRATSPVATIGAVRLETIPDPSLPKRGSGRDANGSFFLSEIRLAVADTPADKSPRSVRFRGGEASHSRSPSTTAQRAIDGNLSTYWDPWPKNHERLSAVFFTVPTKVAGKTLVIQLQSQSSWPNAALGRFRLSVADASAIARQKLRQAIAKNQIDGFVALGAAHALNGDAKQAASAFAVALSKAEPAARAGVLRRVTSADVLAELHKRRPKDAAVLVAIAKRLVTQNRRPEAKTKLVEALSLNPQNVDAAAQLAGLILRSARSGWNIVRPSAMSAKGGAKMSLEVDGSVFVSGPNRGRAIYTLKFKPNKSVRAIRLETLPDTRLPRGSAGRYPENGNFHLAAFGVAIASADGKRTNCPVAWAGADFHQVGDYGLQNAVDGNPSTRWDTYPQMGRPHEAVFVLARPVPQGKELILTLDSGITTWGRHGLGRFRVSVLDDAALVQSEKLRVSARGLTDPWERLAAARRVSGDQAALEKLTENKPGSILGLAKLYAALQDEKRAAAFVQRFLKSTGFGGALFFNGRDNFVTAPHVSLDTSDAFTIEAWVAGWQGDLLCQGQLGDPENGVSIGPTRCAWESGKGRDYVFTLNRKLPGGWTHLAVVFDGRLRLVFLNGKLVDRSAVPRPGPFLRGRQLLIAASQTGRDKPAVRGSGLLAALRISRVARYSSPFTPAKHLKPDAHTILLYDLAQTNDGGLKDRSGNRRHGTIHGRRWIVHSDSGKSAAKGAAPGKKK